MPRDAYDRTCACPHVRNPQHERKITRANITVNRAIAHKNFVVATATLVTVTVCFHNSALPCFILNETFEMVQQQETLYFGSTNLGSHVQFQIFQSNHSCRQGHTCKLTLLCQFFPGMDWFIACSPPFTFCFWYPTKVILL